MYAIYGNIYHQYTPCMLVYKPAPWILWDMESTRELTVFYGVLLKKCTEAIIPP